MSKPRPITAVYCETCGEALPWGQDEWCPHCGEMWGNHSLGQDDWAPEPDYPVFDNEP